MQPRPYQGAALAALKASTDLSPLVVMATGTGKSLVFAMLPQALEIARPDAICVVAHQDELIQQAAAKLRTVDPNLWVEIEQAELRAGPLCDAVVASVPSLTGQRLEDFRRRMAGRIAVLVIDEAHHATAPSYRALIDGLRADRPDLRVIGFTATPQRGDGVGLGAVFSSVAYAYDLVSATHDAWLVPIRCYVVRTAADLTGVPSHGGDFSPKGLARVIDTPERNQLIVDAYNQLAEGRPTLIYLPTRQHAAHLAEAFRADLTAAQTIDATTPIEQRRAVVELFREGRIPVLCVVGLFLEGADLPELGCVMLARPSKSSTLYAQIVGRSLRPSSELGEALGTMPSAEVRTAAIATSTKPDAIIIDLVDVARNHRLATVPLLYGLPPKLDMNGLPLEEAEKIVAAARAVDPEKAEAAETFEQLRLVIERVDPYGFPANPLAAATLPWRYNHGVAALALGQRYTGYDAKGDLIAEFDEKLRTEQGKRKHLNAKGHNPRLATQPWACGQKVGADKTVVTNETLSIVSTSDGFRVTLHAKVNGQTHDHVFATTEGLPEAITRAEGWIRNNRSRAARDFERKPTTIVRAPTKRQLALATAVAS